MRPAVLAGVLWLGILAGCDPVGPPAVSCASTAGPSTPDDTLFIQPLLGAPPRRGRTDVLVRVDSLHVRGAVSFSAPPPPTAAAVSIALTTDATFQGCLNPAPGGFRLLAAEAPRGKLWIRVSSNRPVVVHAPSLATPPGTVPERSDAALPGPPSRPDRFLTIAPGSSARRRWDVGSAPGEPR